MSTATAAMLPLLASDGLPEAPIGNDDQLGYADLERILGVSRGLETGAWIDAVLADVTSQTPARPDDDCTVLVLERTG